MPARANATRGELRLYGIAGIGELQGNRRRELSPFIGRRAASLRAADYANSTETSFSTPSMVMRSFSGAFKADAFWIFSSGFLSSKAERGFL